MLVFTRKVYSWQDTSIEEKKVLRCLFHHLHFQSKHNLKNEKVDASFKNKGCTTPCALEFVNVIHRLLKLSPLCP
jgi:hypothetical protein